MKFVGYNYSYTGEKRLHDELENLEDCVSQADFLLTGPHGKSEDFLDDWLGNIDAFLKRTEPLLKHRCSDAMLGELTDDEMAKIREFPNRKFLSELVANDIKRFRESARNESESEKVDALYYPPEQPCCIFKSWKEKCNKYIVCGNKRRKLQS